MSPRVRILRKVVNPPAVKGFKPYGVESVNQQPECINLLYEEYEALRLSDYEGMNHYQASLVMGVSRPTFTRIYASALRKIAKAFVEGKQISIEGGKVYFDSDWYHCNQCGCYFNNPEKDKPVTHCPLCKHQKVFKVDETNISNEATNNVDLCICPKCGFEQVHQHGQPCGKQICPQCHSFMKRKGSIYCNTI